jgi:hypothetical protein
MSKIDEGKMNNKLTQLIEAVETVIEDYRKYNVHPAPNMVRLCDTLADYKAEEAAPVDDVTSRHIQERLIAWHNTYESGIDPEKLKALFAAADACRIELPEDVFDTAVACRIKHRLFDRT